MGHRREHKERDLQRRGVSQFTGKRILIVCEGSKTEPDYFKGLIRTWKIHPIQVEVIGEECDSAPISVVEYTLDRKKENLRKVKKGLDIKIDDYWCVFDFDQHKSYTRAIYQAKANKLKIAFSIPCFEFWYLLHFRYTEGEFKECDEVVHELKKYIPDYDKTKAPLDKLIPLLDDAIKNAAALRKALKTSGAKGPATEADLLVEELRNVKPIR